MKFHIKSLKKNISKKGGCEKIKEFLSEEFSIPKPSNSPCNKGSVNSENIRELQYTVQTYKDVSFSLASELNVCKEKEEQLEKQVKVRENKSKGIRKLKGELKTAKADLKTLKKQNVVLSLRVRNKDKQLMQIRSQNQYLKRTVSTAKQKTSVQAEKIQDLEAQLQLLKDEFSELQVEYMTDQKSSREEVDWLHHVIGNLQDEELHLFDHDKNAYVKNLQVCVYNLLEHHVSSKHVGPVIDAVLSLVNKKADRLPCVSTIHNMNLQRLALSYKHVSEVLVDKPNTSIYTDETSKFGNKVCGYHVRDEEGNYFTLGLRDLTTKSASDTLETLTQILGDIDHAADIGNDASKKILTNISATMSDSASTEIKFNSLLEEYRATILPYTIENYHELDEEGKQSVSKLNNFFCGLHSLVHFAETCSKTLNEFEKQHFDNKAPMHQGSYKKDGESGTLRLIRTASKAFSRGADEKSGCHLPFVTFIAQFLKDHNMKSLKLVPFRGQRFNILFHNAGQVYLLHEQMTDFLKGFPLNRLTQSVAFDLDVVTYVAGCKALGLISKLVSTPLWNLLEDKSINILDMNKYYLMLKSGLQEATENVNGFMTGTVRPFGEEVYVKEDIVYDTLVAPSHYDDDCEMILSILLAALTKYVVQKFKDFLPGGVFSQPSEEMKVKMKSVEKHNKFSERVFAYYDNLLRYKPHVNTLASEAYIAFAVNKTGKWLKEQPEDKATELVSSARKEVAVIRRNFKNRQEIIKQRRREKLEEARRTKEEQAARELKKLEDITNEIIYYGLWQSTEQVDSMLETIKSKSEKVKALKAQMRFRREIFKQNSGDSAVFRFSKKENGGNVLLSVTELTENVKALVGHALNLPAAASPETQIIVGRRVRHLFTTDGHDVWYTGKVVSQVCLFQQILQPKSMQLYLLLMLNSHWYYFLFLLLLLLILLLCFICT